MNDFNKFMNEPIGEELEYMNGQMIWDVGEKLNFLQIPRL